MGVESSVAKQAKDVDEKQAAIGGFESVRASTFFLVFLHLGFFGVGNVASISSVRDIPTVHNSCLRQLTLTAVV